MTASLGLSGFLRNHRGPYRLVVTRPHRSKKGFNTTEWLTGTEDADDVESEALSLLADPKDTISSVYIWSVREECFVGGYRA